MRASALANSPTAASSAAAAESAAAAAPSAAISAANSARPASVLAASQCVCELLGLAVATTSRSARRGALRHAQPHLLARAVVAVGAEVAAAAAVAAAQQAAAAAERAAVERGAAAAAHRRRRAAGRAEPLPAAHLASRQDLLGRLAPPCSRWLGSWSSSIGFRNAPRAGGGCC